MVIILVFCVFTTRATRWQHQFVSIRFNQASIVDIYPISRIQDLYAKLAGGTKFTKLDMRHTFSCL